MSISAVTTDSSTTSTSSTSTSDAEDLYTTWITLLATQLQNQDPTNPVDATEFTGQLISLSALEQQALSNETLSSLLEVSEDLQTMSAYDYLGANITAYGDTANFTDGSAEWGYELDSSASTVTITVMDADGDTVYTTEGETSSGSHTFTWDGTTDSGGTAEDGTYQISVEATDSDGSAVDVTTTVNGTVTGAATMDGTVVLLMGDIAVPLSYLVSVTQS